jgi:hypothetical protein
MDPTLPWYEYQGPVNKKLGRIKNPAVTIMYACSSLPGVPVPATHTVFDAFNCTMNDSYDFVIYMPYNTKDIIRRPHTVKDEARVLALLDTSVSKIAYPFGGKAKWAWDIGADKLSPRKPK